VGERENGEGYYDRFRGRLIFPIRDRQGQIIAFGGRVLEGAPKDAPKYLNSPQTVLFDKSATLYGFDLAREGIRRNDCAVVVEGYMDVIVAHQNGFTNVVAPLGTALNEKHVALLKKLTKRIVLALDADAAGQKATLHGIEVLKKGFDTFSVAIPNARGLVQFEQQLDADIRIAVLPEGKDPDEVIREDGKLWQTLVDKALPVVDYTFALAASAADLSTARGKSETVETLMPLIVEVRDRIAREHYIQRLSKLTQIAPDLLHSELRRTSNRQQVNRHSNPEATSDVDNIEENATAKPIIQIGSKRGLDIEDKIVAFLLRYPAGFTVSGRDGNSISAKDFTRSENRQLFEAMLVARENNEPFTELDEKLTPELVNHLSVLQEQIALQPELDPYVEVNQDMEFQLNRLRDSRTREIMEVLEDEVETGQADSEVPGEEFTEEDNLEVWGKLNELAAQRKLYAPKPSPMFKDSRDR
jgi:DNA primase